MIGQRNLPTVVADEGAGKPELKEIGDIFVGETRTCY